ncbi:MAG: hypothetical protein KME08_15770 [Aphanothece sp. CMT-3BRIN-NPC111]|nr:hypothetical protein [Aphanothece sp. CMT-3BRIN-NPC111]
MKLKQLLVLSTASVLFGGCGFVTNKVNAEPPTLMAQNSASPTEQRVEGEGRRRGSKFENLPGITEAQKTQLRQIHEASHQQIDAIPTAEQKARMEAIRQNTRTQMDAVLTAEQRQQLQQSSPSTGERKGRGFAKISGLTDAQRTQMRQIHEASHQQMDAILTSEQKARIEAIRQNTKTQMDAVLTAEQRQQLQQLRQQKRQGRQQQQS